MAAYLVYPRILRTETSAPPSAPQNLVATAGDGQVFLTWQAPATDGGSPITSHRVYRGTVSGTLTLWAIVGAIPGYADAPVPNGVTHYYQVSAVNAVGEGARSIEVFATPSRAVSAPSEPRNLQALAVADRVDLTWQAPASEGSSGITGYRLYRGTHPTALSLLAPLGVAESYSDSTVADEVMYYYQVSAVNDVGEGPRSNTAAATIPRSPIPVDSCGANPFDNLPDSVAIQQCIDQAASGDTILFTSQGAPGYVGYLVNRTVFLVHTPPARHDLVFTSTDPRTPALLRASAELKGFVINLVARSQVFDIGRIDDVLLSNLEIDGGRDARQVAGSDGMLNGVDDNWGSWLPECTVFGDPWCSPGGIQLSGMMDWSDATQNYRSNPDAWSTGLVVEGMLIRNVEAGTALGLGGGASGIRNNIIDTAGDHVHAPSCPSTDPDNELYDWSDGITFTGPDHVVTGNIVYDASDIGIVFFGGKNTSVSRNVVAARGGNHGMFGGIAIHPWIFGDVSGLRVTGNRVESEGNATCGGIHAGIQIGPQMWGAGCVGSTNPSAVGNTGSCTAEPIPPGGALCTAGQPCQVWAYIARGSTLTLRDNFVRGAQVNFLVEGLDLQGTLVAENNFSDTPRDTDWEASAGCTCGGVIDSWGTYDFVAHSPTLPGWTEARIHCER